MILTFSQDVLTANESKRELTGVIVPFGKIGYTNMGEVTFEAGSLEIPEDIKLYVEHDMQRFFQISLWKLHIYDFFTKQIT